LSAPVAAIAYRDLPLTELNRIPSFIAFCATAPRVRRSFLAACGCDSFAFAYARRFFTSSFDHAEIIRRRCFAMSAPLKKAHHTGAAVPFASYLEWMGPSVEGLTRNASLKLGDLNSSMRDFNFR